MLGSGTLSASETQTEEIPVSDVDQHRMGEDTTTDETLDMLALQRRLKHCCFKDYVIRENEADKTFIAGDIRRRRRIDVCHADRIQSKLRRDSLANDTPGSARIDHGDRGDRHWDSHAGGPKRSFNHSANSDADINDGSNTVEVWNLRREGRHVKRRAGSR